MEAILGDVLFKRKCLTSYAKLSLSTATNKHASWIHVLSCYSMSGSHPCTHPPASLCRVHITGTLQEVMSGTEVS